jgi:hypothetical protein
MLYGSFRTLEKVMLELQERYGKNEEQIMIHNKILEKQKDEREQELRKFRHVDRRVTKVTSDLNNENLNTNLNCIFLNKPDNYNGFVQKLYEFHQTTNEYTQQHLTQNEPYNIYTINRTPSIQYIEDCFETIYQGLIKPFKTTFALGYIMEDVHKDVEGNDVFTYFIYHPIKHQINPTIVQNDIDKNKYNNTIRDKIQDLYEKGSSHEERSSRMRIIAVTSVAFFTYNLQSSGKKLPLLDKFIKDRYLFCYNVDNNLCFFAVFTSFQDFKCNC